jgi:hypothetical protein
MKEKMTYLGKRTVGQITEGSHAEYSQTDTQTNRQTDRQKNNKK